jgi:hypothetical protein
VYRSARALIQRHGEAAAFEAAMKVDMMLDEGYLGGAAVWLRTSTREYGVDGTRF